MEIDIDSTNGLKIHVVPSRVDLTAGGAATDVLTVTLETSDLSFPTNSNCSGLRECTAHQVTVDRDGSPPPEGSVLKISGVVLRGTDPETTNETTLTIKGSPGGIVGPSTRRH